MVIRVKITVDKQELKNLNIIKDNIYELDEDQPIVQDMYKIKVPMKQKGKFRYALIKDDEGVLVE